MDKFDIIIVGAGISGLSLAHYCAGQGLKPLVLERTERAGGAFHSHCLEGGSNGFWLELGAHTCYNSYRNLIGIIENCRILERLIRREKVPFKMFVDNRIKSIPSQLDFLELFLSAPRIFTLTKENQSVGSYYSRVVGLKNFERVFAPAFNAVISQRADDFPADMLFKKRRRRKDVMKKFTFTGGLQTITDTIASQKDIRLIKGSEVEEIRIAGEGFHVITPDGVGREARYLALAAPASVAARLLQASFPEVSQKLAQVKVNSVDSVGVVVKNKVTPLTRVAGIFPRNDSFFSAVSRDTVPHADYRGFTFHFKPGLMDLDSKLRRIAGVLGIRPDQIEHVVAKENLIPSLKLGHDKLICEVDRLIEDKRLFLTGNYFNGVAIEDCVSRSLKEFNRVLSMQTFAT